MSMIIREDFLKTGETAPKLVPADSYDKMMKDENFLNANTSEVETVRNWNHHRWEQQGLEPLDSLHTQFNHWKVDGLGRRPIIQDDFFAVSGKGKLCKGAGLTGAEARACKKNIKNKCGGKPLFGSRAKKDKWAQCASEQVVTPEESAQATADKLIPTSAERSGEDGMGAGVKVLLAVAIVGTVALIGFALMKGKKTNQMSAVKPMPVK